MHLRYLNNGFCHKIGVEENFVINYVVKLFWVRPKRNLTALASVTGGSSKKITRKAEACLCAPYFPVYGMQLFLKITIETVACLLHSCFIYVHRVSSSHHSTPYQPAGSLHWDHESIPVHDRADGSRHFHLSA
jgi:hypothetical protein